MDAEALRGGHPATNRIDRVHTAEKVRARRVPGWLGRTDRICAEEELANRSGLHRTYVGAIERAERNVSLATVEALATGLDRDPVDLLRE